MAAALRVRVRVSSLFILLLFFIRHSIVTQALLYNETNKETVEPIVVVWLVGLEGVAHRQFAPLLKTIVDKCGGKARDLGDIYDRNLCKHYNQRSFTNLDSYYKDLLTENKLTVDLRVASFPCNGEQTPELCHYDFVSHAQATSGLSSVTNKYLYVSRNFTRTAMSHCYYANHKGNNKLLIRDFYQSQNMCVLQAKKLMWWAGYIKKSYHKLSTFLEKQRNMTTVTHDSNTEMVQIRYESFLNKENYAYNVEKLASYIGFKDCNLTSVTADYPFVNTSMHDVEKYNVTNKDFAYIASLNASINEIPDL